MRGYAAVGLRNPKTPINLGHALRAVSCYDASLLLYDGKRLKPGATNTHKTDRHKPVLHVDDIMKNIPYGAVPVAVDLIQGARPLQVYSHPPAAFYIFGPEDGTLGHSVLKHCRDVVYVPTKFCMNLAATVNVVLYDRLAAQLRRER